VNCLPDVPDLRLDRDPDMGTPRFVRRRSAFLTPPAPAASPEAVRDALLDANGRAFTLHHSDLDPPNARVTRDIVTTHNGMRSLTWQQEHEGVDIYGAVFMMNLDRENRIVNVSSRALHVPSLRFHDVVDVSAEEILKGREEAQKGAKVIREPELIWYPLDMITVVKAWDLIVEGDFNSQQPARNSQRPGTYP
jgi:hypothetical protein